VTEADDVLFGRAELERAFTALGERLARRGVVADVFVLGGAAMALAYDATRVTGDVDATFLPQTPSGCPTGGLTSRPASTSLGSTTQASAACSTIPGCVSWRHRRPISSR
jgi:hypothetical protein